MNGLSLYLGTKFFGKYIKEDLIELDLDLNLILTLKAKLVNFPTICYIFVLYFWI
jgi:hypothetical protein